MGELQIHDVDFLAADIEQALHHQLEDRAYTSQARSVLHNLKDPKNCLFRFKVLVGFIGALEIPTLSGEEMASETQNAERTRVRKECLKEAVWEGGVKYCKHCKGRKTTYKFLDEPPDGSCTPSLVHVT